MVEFIYVQPLHSCDYCGLEYWKTPAYIKHLIEMHNADLPKCSFCQKPFLSNKELQEHIDEIHRIKRHKCLKCSCTFKWLKDLKNHLGRKHGPNAKPVLQCNHCGLMFYQRAEHTEHILGVHWTKQIFECEICSHKFRYRSQLIKHIQIKHGSLNQWKKCKFCPASYKWTRDLENHYDQKHKEFQMKTTQTGDPITYKCDVCNVSFNLKNHLVNHLNKFHLSNESTCVSLQKCLQCSEVFKTRKLLSQHSLVHDIELLSRETYETTERPDRLIIVPNSFPENIVDFEAELRRRLEYSNLIKIRENICENGNRKETNIEFGNRNLNEKKLVNDDVILATPTDMSESEINDNTFANNLNTSEKSNKACESASDKNDGLLENSNYCDRFQLKDLKIVFVRLEDEIKKKSKEKSNNIISRKILASTNTIKENSTRVNTTVNINLKNISVSNVCQEPLSLDTKSDTDLKNENKSQHNNFKELKIIITRIEDIKLNLQRHEVNNSKQLEDSNKDLEKSLNIESSKPSNVNEHLNINEPLINNVSNERNIAKFHSCQLCSQKFRVEESLNRHILEGHSNGRTSTHKCHICDAGFPFKHYLRLHLKGEHSINRKKRLVPRIKATCETSKMKFKTKHLYYNHIKRKHLKNIHKTLHCRICNMVCNNRMTLIRHCRLMHSEIHKCGQCSSVFDSIDLLREHQESEHSNALCYTCKICTATYSRKVRLEEHLHLNHRYEHKRLILENDLVKTSNVEKINRVGVVSIQRENRLKPLKANFKKAHKIQNKSIQTTAKQSNSKLVLESEYPFNKNDRNNTNDLSEFKYDLKNNSMDQTIKKQTTKNVTSKFKTKSKLKSHQIRKEKLKLGCKINIGELRIIKEKPLGDQSKTVEPNIPKKSIKKQKSILKSKGIFCNIENTLKVKDLNKSVSLQLDELSLKTNDDLGSIAEVTLHDSSQQIKETQNVFDNLINNIADNTRDPVTDDEADDVRVVKNYQNADFNCSQDNIDLDQLLEESSMICTDMEDVAVIFDNSKDICLKNKRVHLKYNNSTVPVFECDSCNLVFESKKLLYTHMKHIHHKVYTCFVCHAIFKRKGGLTRHITKKHKGSVFKNNPTSMLQHIFRDHSYCKRIMNKKTIVENILTYENHSTIPFLGNDTININPSKTHQYKCNYCDSRFPFSEKLQRHMKQFHKITSKVNVHKCDTCNILFNSKEHLYDHEKLVHPMAQIKNNKKSESTFDQGEDDIQVKRFKWKKALAQTYENETF